MTTFTIKCYPDDVEELEEIWGDVVQSISSLGKVTVSLHIPSVIQSIMARYGGGFKQIPCHTVFHNEVYFIKFDHPIPEEIGVADELNTYNKLKPVLGTSLLEVVEPFTFYRYSGFVSRNAGPTIEQLYYPKEKTALDEILWDALPLPVITQIRNIIDRINKLGQFDDPHGANFAFDGSIVKLIDVGCIYMN